MELHSVHKIFHHNHLGEEKHQMLNLNRRLETYLSRVKLLEEENALLAKEIQAMRHSDCGALTHRKCLEEELLQARMEVDAAWRDRVLTELEVGKLTEELQALDLQRQREAQAQVKAKAKLEQSRKELEEEQRAQIWLREKVSQLEHEMRLLIQTHQEDVAHLEATLTRSRATMPHTLGQRSNQTPNLLQLGEEYSQRASRAWQETAEAYQGQLARLEESLSEARSRLTRVGQEKREGQLKLQALEKEIASAQDVRMHLEKTAAQQSDIHSHEIQQLQEHLEGLEVEKEELGEQINHLLLENRGLLQMKMTLGLEVATYRALLDSESLGGHVSLNQPRNTSVADAVFSPQGVKKNYQTQLSASHKTSSLSSVRGIAGPTVITAAPVWRRKPVTLNETPKISGKPAAADATKSAAWETPYPKILQDGAVENFRPREVCEKVTYAEPLSPPNEQEASAETTSEDKEGEEHWSNVDVGPADERPVVESVVSGQVQSGLSSEQSFNDEVGHHQSTAPSLTPYHVRMTEELCGFSDESDNDVACEGGAGKQDMQQPHVPIEAWVKEECMGKEVEHVQEESSDPDTEALLEPTSESRPSSPESECEPEESVFNQVTDYSRVERRQEVSCSLVGANEADVEDKLYPDGEEMDTWDSVIERKVDPRTDDGVKSDEGRRQHAEPEEDISAKEPERAKRELRQDVHQDVASAGMDTQVDEGQHPASEQEHIPPPDEDDDDEEDSQNVSVSWRTELESDSYAQDNTLADTRPLIRYKSDETDANTQASHMDESESSEGDQEKKIGETGTWSESKSKKFGTMEDLCEEVEGETMDELYNLGYTHMEDRDDGDGTLKDTESAEVNEGHSDGKTEGGTNPMVDTSVDYDEELETDRLVEQELENLSTDYYSAQFSQRQVSAEMLHLMSEAGEPETEDMPSCVEAGVRVNHGLTDQTSEDLFVSVSSAAMPQKEAEENIQYKEAIDMPAKREEDEHNASIVTHADEAEDQPGFSDFISRPNMEEINNPEDPNSVLRLTADQEYLQDVAVPTEVKEAVPVEASNEPQKHPVEDAADCQEVPEAPETTDWEVLENPREDVDTRDRNEHDQKGDNVSADEGAMTHQEEPLEISPDSVPDENDIFTAKEATDGALHDFFPADIKSDFWLSSLESGATYQPDDACNEAAEHTNQNLVWGNSENQNAVNGNSRLDIESSKALAAKKEQEQMHREVKQVCRSDEGELIHSEESEVEGESWSSGEERA